MHNLCIKYKSNTKIFLIIKLYLLASLAWITWLFCYFYLLKIQPNFIQFFIIYFLSLIFSFFISLIVSLHLIKLKSNAQESSQYLLSPFIINYSFNFYFLSLGFSNIVPALFTLIFFIVYNLPFLITQTYLLFKFFQVKANIFFIIMVYLLAGLAWSCWFLLYFLLDSVVNQAGSGLILDSVNSLGFLIFSFVSSLIASFVLIKLKITQKKSSQYSTWLLIIYYLFCLYYLYLILINNTSYDLFFLLVYLYMPFIIAQAYFFYKLSISNIHLKNKYKGQYFGNPR